MAIIPTGRTSKSLKEGGIIDFTSSAIAGLYNHAMSTGIAYNKKGGATTFIIGVDPKTLKSQEKMVYRQCETQDKKTAVEMKKVETNAKYMQQKLKSDVKVQMQQLKDKKYIEEL